MSEHKHYYENNPPYRTMQPHNAEGEFMRQLDRAERNRQDAIYWKWYGLFLLVVFLCGGPISCLMAAGTPDQVRILELNPLLFRQYPDHVMAEITSIDEAEDWLLAQGYTVRKINTRNKSVSGGHVSEGFSVKTFFVRCQANSENESVVCIIVDDGRWKHAYPFTTTDEDSPLDFSRFERSPVPDGFTDVAFELGAYSTHDFNSAPWGYDPAPYEKEKAKWEADAERSRRRDEARQQR